MVGEGLVLENVEKPLLEEEQVERPRDEMSGKVVRKAADMRSVIKVQLLNTAQGQENWLPGKTGKIKKSPVPKGLRYLTHYQSWGPRLGRAQQRARLQVGLLTWSLILGNMSEVRARPQSQKILHLRRTIPFAEPIVFSPRKPQISSLELSLRSISYHLKHIRAHQSWRMLLESLFLAEDSCHIPAVLGL